MHIFKSKQGTIFYVTKRLVFSEKKLMLKFIDCTSSKVWT